MKLSLHPSYPQLLPPAPVWPDRGDAEDAVLLAFDLPTVIHKPSGGVGLDKLKWHPSHGSEVQRLVQESAVSIIRLKGS